METTGRQDCDRCGAEAKFGVDLNNGGTLYFCGHHFNDNKTALESNPAVLFVGRLGELAATEGAHQS